MRRPFPFAMPLAVAGSAVTAAVALGASIPVYANKMASAGARADFVRVGQSKCSRGGAAGALKVSVGKRTRECQLRTPVVGADLDITATARLLAGTPTPIQAHTFVAVGLRVGDGGRYQLAVFPKKGSFQLRRETSSGDLVTVLGKGKASVIKGLGKPNKLRLKTFPTAGGTRVGAYVNGRNLASVVEDAQTASGISGRLSTLGVGSSKAATGAAASFDDVTVAIPDPF